MNWLVENPWPVVIVGAGIELALLVALYMTGRLRTVVWMLVVAAITGGYWLLEQQIVTEREQIEANLYEIAAAFENRDVATVEKHISKSAPVTLTEAQQAARLPFAEVRINSGLKIDVRDDFDPPEAEASGTVTVTMTSGFTKPMPVQITVYLRKVDGKWLIVRHEKPHLGIR
jgi:hypothetical protein